MVRKGCRFWKEINDMGVCLNTNSRDPDCDECERKNEKLDELYNYSEYHLLLRDSSPSNAKRLYNFIARVVEDGILDDRE